MTGPTAELVVDASVAVKWLNAGRTIGTARSASDARSPEQQASSITRLAGRGCQSVLGAVHIACTCQRGNARHMHTVGIHHT